MCAYYCGIYLLDICLKWFEIVLFDQFKQLQELRIKENQAGFHSGHGCCNQVFTL